jgi:hypothetical protein
MPKPEESEKIVSARRPKLDESGKVKAGEFDERDFTGTQWDAMGKDKGGWEVAKPSEATKGSNKPGGVAPDAETTAAEAALLNARERYEALFERKPHHSKGLASLEADIAAELKKQNEGNPPAPAAGATGTANPAPAAGAVTGAEGSAGATDAQAKANGDAAADKGNEAAS